jgi:hypothetical protein
MSFFFAPFAVNKEYLIKADDSPMAVDNPLMAEVSSCAADQSFSVGRKRYAAK